MISENLKLWESVEKTDPKHTKNANVGGNKITAIKPQYQIYIATKQWGSYGNKWGFKNINLSYDLLSFNLVVFKALFFYPDGEFEIINSIKLYKDNALTKVDDDFAKKIETDALTKALSKLGFNADVFIGRFDDNRYVEEMDIAHGNKPPLPTKEELIKEAIEAMRACTSISSLQACWAHYKIYQPDKEFISSKEEMKKKLLKQASDGTK